MATVRLVRDGHDPVDVLPSQVTPFAIARIFSVIFIFRCIAIECDRSSCGSVMSHRYYSYDTSEL